MSEGLGREKLNSWFYPAMRGEMPRLPLVASLHAVQKRNELRKNWLMKPPKLPMKFPWSALAPG